MALRALYRCSCWAALALLLMANVQGATSGNTCTWDGSSSNNWGVNANWGGCGLLTPGSDDTAVVSNCATRHPSYQGLNLQLSALQLGGGCHMSTTQSGITVNYFYSLGGAFLTVVGGPVWLRAFDLDAGRTLTINLQGGQWLQLGAQSAQSFDGHLIINVGGGTSSAASMWTSLVATSSAILTFGPTTTFSSFSLHQFPGRVDVRGTVTFTGESETYAPVIGALNVTAGGTAMFTTPSSAITGLTTVQGTLIPAVPLRFGPIAVLAPGVLAPTVAATALTFALGTSGLNIIATLSGWSGLLNVTATSSASSLRITSATTTAGASPVLMCSGGVTIAGPTAVTMASGDALRVDACSLTGAVSITGGALNSATAHPFGVAATGSLVVSGTTVGSAGASTGQIAVDGTMQLTGGATVTSNCALSGTGTVWFDGATVHADASLTTTTLRGPSSTQTTTFQLNGASRTLSGLSQWGGTVSVVGSSTAQGLVLTSSTIGHSNARLTCSSASFRAPSTVALSGLTFTLSDSCDVTGASGTTLSISGSGSFNTGTGGAVLVADGVTLAVNGQAAIGTVANAGRFTIGSSAAASPPATMLVTGQVTVSSTCVIDGPGILSLGTATFLFPASITPATVSGPISGATTTVNLNGASRTVPTLVGWTGTLHITSASSTQALALTSATVAASTARLKCTTAPMGGPSAVGLAGYTLTIESGCTLSGVVSLTGPGTVASSSATPFVIGSSASVSLLGGAALGTGAVNTGAVTVAGTLTVSEASTIAANADVGGTGTLVLSGAIVAAGNSVTTTNVQGPAAASVTTTVQLSGARTLPAIGQWAGFLRVVGSGTLSVASATMTTANSGLFSVNGAGVSIGGGSLQGTVNASSAATLTLTGAVGSGKTLIIHAPTPNSLSLAGTLTANGLLRLMSGTKVISGGVGGSGAGTLQLNGCTVASGVTVSAATILGPSVGQVTTFGTPLTVPSLSQWSGNVSCEGTGTVTLTSASTTGTAAALLNPTGLCSISGAIAMADASTLYLHQTSVAASSSLAITATSTTTGGLVVALDVSVAGAAVLTLSSGVTLAALSTVTGTGSLALSGSTVQSGVSVGGSVSVFGPTAAALTTTLALGAAPLSLASLAWSTGTIRVTGSATLTIGSIAQNGATAALRLASAASVVLNGGVAVGIIDAVAGAVVTANGLAVSGSASLEGSLALRLSFSSIASGASVAAGVFLFVDANATIGVGSGFANFAALQTAPHAYVTFDAAGAVGVASLRCQAPSGLLLDPAISGSSVATVTAANTQFDLTAAHPILIHRVSVSSSSQFLLNGVAGTNWVVVSGSSSAGLSTSAGLSVRYPSLGGVGAGSTIVVQSADALAERLTFVGSNGFDFTGTSSQGPIELRLCVAGAALAALPANVAVDTTTGAPGGCTPSDMFWACSSNPCVAANSLTCTATQSAFQCTCKPGFSGNRCQTNISECASSPCRHGGSCLDAVDSFSCQCPAGFVGALCETDLDECASGPCDPVGTVTCVDGANGFSCACVAGYSGALCTTEINECGSAPCANGGTCTDALNGFNCACLPGFSGAFCTTNVNECASQPCQNVAYGSVCVDGVDSFSCTCGPGLTGTFCETNTDECASNPCINGVCEDRLDEFYCACNVGWGGAQCQTQLIACTSLPCQNGGDCVDMVGGGYTCTCPAGWSGTVCETAIDECASSPCAHGGTCTDGPNGYSCACAVGYSGVTCRTDINECASVPCLHGQQCVDQVGSFSCLCVGYTGRFCESDINECGSSPCVRGSCVDAAGAFSCTCPAGYSGAYCQSDVNECASRPCANGGTCTDGVNSFGCLCAAGYAGRLCESDVDECASAPCQNGGTCAAGVAAFSCTCRPGYTGRLCETDVAECASLPCLHGGTCLDGVGVFTCSCVGGFTGSQCQDDVNECATNNGGCGSLSTCTNAFGSHNCTAFVVPLTLSSLQPVYSAVPLVLGSTGGQSVCFNLSLVAIPLSAITVRVGPYDCTGLTATGPADDASSIWPVCCLVAPGVGASHSLVLAQWGTVVYSSVGVDLVSYPPPLIEPGSLRRNDTGYSSTPTTFLALDSNQVMRVQFTGSNFYAEPLQSELAVFYGPTAGDLRYRCALVPAATSPSVITCRTEAESEAYNVFTVVVGGQSTSGTDIASFPEVPRIERVSGCTDSGATNSTAECPTSGAGLTLTITGCGFIQIALTVSVNGNVCASPVVTIVPTQIQCTLPAGAGANRAVVVTAQGQSSVPAYLLSYAVATVDRIEGCSPGPTAARVVRCPRSGGVVLQLIGRNFGAAGAVVLIGGQLGIDVVQNETDPHSRLRVTVPAGTGVGLPVLLVQGGGSVGPSNATVSYEECAEGTVVADLLCPNCAAGSFSSQLNAQRCERCAAGTYAGVGGLSFCSNCPAGSVSGAGASACSNCTAGRYTSVEGQVTCEPCATGRFAPLSGSTVCTDCRLGTYQTDDGASACVECELGTSSVDPTDQCAPCGVGTYTNATGSTACIDCPTATFGPDAGLTACPLCAVGSYGLLAGLSACTQCEAGRFASVQGATVCTKCAPYSYSASNGAAECKPCIGNTYQKEEGQASCTKCAFGQYYLRSAEKCVDCPHGTRCTADAIDADGNFFVFRDDAADGALAALECPPGYCESCTPSSSGTAASAVLGSGSGSGAGGADGLNVSAIDSAVAMVNATVFSCCTANRLDAASNPLCGRCRPGHTLSGSSCVWCPEPNGPMIVGMLALSWAYVTLFYVLAQSASADSRILINYAQYLYLFMSGQSEALFNWLSVVNFNVFKSGGGSGGSCIAPLTDMQRLSMGFLIPLIAVGFLFVNLLIHYAVWRLSLRCRARVAANALKTAEKMAAANAESAAAAGHGAHRLIGAAVVAPATPKASVEAATTFQPILLSYKRAFLGFVASSYASSILATFSFFSCVRVNGDVVVHDFPAISCAHSPEYARLLPLFICLAVLITALPIVMFCRLYVLRRRGVLFDGGYFQTVYGILCDTYTPHRYFWECVVLVRRLVLVSVSIASGLSQDSSSRFTFLSLINLLFLLAHELIRPYRLREDNLSESAAGLALTILTVLLIGAPSPLSLEYAIGLSLMSFVICAALVVRVFRSRIVKFINIAERRVMEAATAKAAASSPRNGPGSGQGTHGSSAEADTHSPDAVVTAVGAGPDSPRPVLIAPRSSSASATVVAAAAAAAAAVVPIAAEVETVVSAASQSSVFLSMPSPAVAPASTAATASAATATATATASAGPFPSSPKPLAAGGESDPLLRAPPSRAGYAAGSSSTPPVGAAPAPSVLDTPHSPATSALAVELTAIRVAAPPSPAPSFLAPPELSAP